VTYRGYQLMSKQVTKTCVPKLRFPEFWNAGEWEEVKLKQLGELVSGLTYSPDDIRDSGLLVLRSSNVQNGEIVLGNNVFVTPDIKGANLSQPNDILICVRNGSKALIGKNALIPEGIPLCTHGAFMTVFRSNSADFVFQLFQTQAYYRQVEGDLGATINSINGSQFIKYCFHIPEPKEQQKIANCLSSLDELITAHSQKHEALKAHKKGLMQQLFPTEGETVPKLRFPEFRDAGEWEEKNISELVIEYRLGGNYSNSETKTKFPLIKMGNISRGEINLNKLEYITTDENIDEIDKIKYGDLFFNTRNTLDLVGKVAIWRNELQVAYYNSNLMYLKFDNNFFMNYKLNSHVVIKAFKAIATGSTSVAAIYTKDLLKVDLSTPSPEEQQKIANCLSSIDDLITAQAQKIETLKAHKKGLMQQLFPSTEALA